LSPAPYENGPGFDLAYGKVWPEKGVQDGAESFQYPELCGALGFLRVLEFVIGGPMVTQTSKYARVA